MVEDDIEPYLWDTYFWPYKEEKPEEKNRINRELLIEDDLATIRLITSYFESKNIVCKGLVSGTKGLEELGRGIPKVILLDIILPDLSGYDICKTIKSDKEYSKIPVYFLTAISSSEVEKHLVETRADGYILKPFNFSDFEIIFDILNGKAKVSSN